MGRPVLAVEVAWRRAQRAATVDCLADIAAVAVVHQRRGRLRCVRFVVPFAAT